MKLTWQLNPGTLGLTFLTIAPGYSGKGRSPQLDATDRARALTETAIIGLSAAYVTKSWWPIAGPIAYLAADYLWLQKRMGASPDLTNSGAYPTEEY